MKTMHILPKGPAKATGRWNMSKLVGVQVGSDGDSRGWRNLMFPFFGMTTMHESAPSRVTCTETKAGRIEQINTATEHEIQETPS